MASNIVLAFDLYGTLLSTESIARQLGEHFPAKAQSISSLWRRYQLEYTWRLNSMDVYEPFSTVTRNALVHALAEHDETLPDDDITALMNAYDSLSTFPDVKPTLNELDAIPTVRAVVFSNGTQSMVSNSVRSSPDLAPHATVFADIVSVDGVKQFKPAPAVYLHLAERVGKAAQLEDVWLVSGNPFDVVGARSVGLNAIWVDRAGQGWIDAAVPGERPTVVVRSLEEILDVVKERV
ncbi:haloacid dehalogenase, type II [Aspergillus lucknowensis]|uniref:HAD-like domain-containing protein n=1 Tax=Aspergillus lucknowensis TaxID=176173 RepID=A0ABR4M2Z1_9EURO